MRPQPAFDRLNELLLVAGIAFGASLLVLAAAMGVRWLSVDWSAACHRLLQPSAPPHFAAPWRVSNLHARAPCLRRP
jgi:hypothetical protein